MRKATVTALLTSSLLSSPALAVHGISYDGSSMMTAYNDPYAIPIGNPTNVRYGTVNFRFASVGQVNDGWVQYFTTMYPSNQIDGPFKIRFLTSPYSDVYLSPGGQCPDLMNKIDNHTGDNNDGSLDLNQLKAWMDSNCSDRPDPHLYNSGSPMALQLLLSSVDGGWLDAIWYWKVPMDGEQYNYTIFWSTGRAGVGPPYAKLVVSQRNGPTGTLTDPDYVDASYNYSDDGFDVQFSNVFWQGGCDTTDTSYVDTCVTGLTAEFWLYPANDAGLPEITPMNTVMGFFLNSDDNSAAWLGSYGQFLMLYPPEIYLTGGVLDDVPDQKFLINAADVGYGLTVPQTFLSQAWSQDGSSNPNFYGLGAGIQAAGRDF